MTFDPGPAAAATTRPWSLDELRRATYLAYGTSARSGRAPNVAALAAAAGVAPSTARRWLNGAQQPSPANLTRLRRALLPGRAVLTRQADERAWATRAATTMQAAGGRGITPQWRAQGWHESHDVFLLHHDDLGIHRVAVALARRSRPLEVPAGWARVDVVELPNRPTGLLLKHVVLDAVAGWRVAVRTALVDKGASECWLASAPTPSLTALAVEHGWR